MGDDGGETQFLIDDEIKGVLPLPNRIVGFDSNLLHNLSFRDNHRFTLAAKFSSLPTEILKEKNIPSFINLNNFTKLKHTCLLIL